MKASAHQWRTILVATTILSLSAPSALAQLDDEIIVTATKREQTLQEVPVAVTVTPAETIERAQILDINDLQTVVPSLRVSQNQNSTQTTFEIRGFGNGANNVGIEPAVGVFIDGVYRSRAAAQIGDLPRLERVEVLRGPQSTLFGKNSSAGVISIVTAAPSFESEGYIEAGLANYDGINGRAYLSGPVTENLAASIGGSFNSRDGYAESFVDGIPDVNDRDRFSLRGQLLYEPIDTFAMRLIADYGKIDEICCHVTNLQNGPTAALIQSPAIGGVLADPADPFAYIDYSDQTKFNDIEDYGVSLQVDAGVSDSIDVVSISSYRRNNNFIDSGVDYTTASLVDSVAVDNTIDTFTQELRLQGLEERFSWLLGGYLFYEEISGVSTLDFGTQFRDYLGALTAVSGADPVADPFAAGAATLSGIEQALGLPTGRFFTPGLATREDYDQSNTSYSVFANVDFDVTDRLTLTGGVSYIKDNKDVVFRQTQNNGVFSQLDFAGGDAATVIGAQALAAQFQQIFGLPLTPQNIAAVTATPQGAAGFGQLQAGVGQFVGSLNLFDPAQNPLLGLAALQFTPPLVGYPNLVEDGKSDDDEVTYTLRAAFDVTDAINVYAGYSTGFKATSWNLSRDTRPTAAGFTALDAAGLLPDITAVSLTRAQLAAGAPIGPYIGTRFAEPEKSEVIEGGIKGGLGFGGVDGVFALTLFQQTIDDFQANVFQGAGFVLTNAGKQRTRGVEWETQISSDALEGLSLDLSGRYLDAEYIDFQFAPGVGGSVDASGDRVDGVSPWAVLIGAQYERDIGNFNGFVRGNWLFESETDIALNVPGERGTNAFEGVPGFTRKVSQFDFAAGLGMDNGLSIEGWIRNAFNDEYFQVGFPGVTQAGTFNAYPNAPRTYGVNLRYDF